MMLSTTLMRRVCWCWFVLIPAPCAVHATENLRLELHDLAVRILQLESFRLNVAVKVFSAQETNHPSHQTKAIIERNGDKIRTSVGPLTVLSTPDVIIVADHLGKSIQYSENPSQPSVAHDSWLRNVDALMTSLVDSGYSVSDGGITESGRKLDVVSDSSTIQQMTIWIDTASQLLSRIRYAFGTASAGESGTVDISYDWEILRAIDSTVFSTAHFVTLKDGKLVPAAEYAGFEIVEMSKQAGESGE